MKGKKIWFIAMLFTMIGVLGISCSNASDGTDAGSDDDSTTATSGTNTDTDSSRVVYLYNATDGSSDFTISLDGWGAAGYSEITDGSTYTYYLESTDTSSSWGACVAYQFSESALIGSENIAFKVKTSESTITCKVGDTELSVSLTGDYATDLGNDWYQITIPIADEYASDYEAGTYIGIFDNTNDSAVIDITDVSLTGDTGVYDASALTTAVDDAQDTIDSTTVSDSIGDYEQSAVDTYQAAVTEAESHESDTDQDTIIAAIDTLAEATTTFVASANAMASGPVAYTADVAATAIAYATDEKITGTEMTVSDWSQSWWGGFTTTDYESDDGTSVKKIVFGDTAGNCGAWACDAIDWTLTDGATPYIHLDICTTATSLKVKPVGATDSDEAVALEITDFGTADDNGWYSVDVDLSDYTYLDFYQIGFVCTTGSDVFYLDNVYFYEQ
jgi:hypothetical protein